MVTVAKRNGPAVQTRAVIEVETPLDPEAVKISSAKLKMKIDQQSGEVVWAEIGVTADHDQDIVNRAAKDALAHDAS